MSENVCIDVTETKCEVVPYKECKVRKYYVTSSYSISITTDGTGGDEVHREEVGPEVVRGEELLPGQEESPAHQTLPQLSERDKAE